MISQGVYIAPHPFKDKINEYTDLYKLGCSIHIKQRLKALSTPFLTNDKFKSIHRLHGPDYIGIRGVKILEDEIHRFYTNVRVDANREFFHLRDVSNEIQNFVSHMKTIGKTIYLDGMQDYVEEPKVDKNTSFQFRDEQLETIEKTVSHLQTHSKAVINEPCGWGKTLVSSEICVRLKKKTLIICPLVSLCDAWHKIWSDRCDDNVEIINNETNGKFSVNKTCITTYQTALKNYDLLSQFELIIFDEAHHLIASKYKRLRETENQHLFLTATFNIPLRKITENETRISIDKSDIMSQTSLYDNIKKGVLCDYKLYTHDAEIDDLPLHDLLNELRNIYERYRIVLFFNERNNAKEAKKQFDVIQNGFKTFYIDGQSSAEDRRRIERNFRKPVCFNDDENETRQKSYVLFNVRVIGEGVDLPPIDCIVFIEKRCSPIGLMQNIGRGLRRSPNKEWCMIVTPLSTEQDSTINHILSTLYYIGGDKNVSTKIWGKTLSVYETAMQLVDRVINIKENSLTYENAKKIVQEHKLDEITEESYKELCQKDDRLPLNPKEVFTKTFVSWFDYLGIPTHTFYNIDECVKHVKELLSSKTIKLNDFNYVECAKQARVVDKRFPPSNMWIDFYKVPIDEIIIQPKYKVKIFK